jgi:hypothetical protein
MLSDVTRWKAQFRPNHRVESPPCLTRFIDCGASFLQGVFPGKFHTRELFIPAMKRCGSFGVLYKSVIAFPISMRLLLKLHFDFDSFVDGLNHTIALFFHQRCPCFTGRRGPSLANGLLPGLIKIDRFNSDRLPFDLARDSDVCPVRVAPERGRNPRISLVIQPIDFPG